MGDSIGGHAGIRILEIPDLRGISMDNYVSKMDIRCLKKCKKRNTYEDTRLKMQLKVDEKVRDIFSNNLKLHEEATAKKLMKFRMAWDDIHPRQSAGTSLQSGSCLKKEGTSGKDLTLPKLPISNTMSHSPKPNATILVTPRSLRSEQPVLTRHDTFDERIVNFMNAKWYSNREHSNTGEFDRKIPLTLKQQRFLAKLQGLLVPKMETKAINAKKQTGIKHSRLWVDLPYAMDGGAIGALVRQNISRLDDAPFLDISQDKLSTSKKQDTMTTWIGLETSKEIERFMEARSKTVIEEE